MKNIIKEGIYQTEKMATFPLKAAKDLLGDSNKAVGEMVDMGQELISIPFRIARQTVDTMINDDLDVDVNLNVDVDVKE